MRIVGIHGIWQGKTTSTTLSAEWSAALTKALRTHHGPACPLPPLTVAYYGHLFRNPSRHLNADENTALVDDDEPFTDEEEAFVLGTLAEYIPPGTDTQDIATETLGLGIPYAPRPVAQALAAADRTLGRGVGRHLLKPIRQVYRYLHHDIGDRIRDEVRTELHRPGPRMVIAHSLGSVIAYDMLTRQDTGPGPDGLTTLVTCGSPLGWLTVRRSLGCEDGLSLPAGIDWINLRASGDIVAHGGLASLTPAIQDEVVNNGIAEPHAASRYLSQQALAGAVTKAASL